MQNIFYSVFYFITGLLAPARPTEKEIEGLTLEKLQALARYDGTLPYREPAVRALVWELKYRANAHARALAGAYLADVLLAEAEESIGTLLLIPVPMHKARRKERGHNQTELLCESALKVLGASGKSARKNSLAVDRTLQKRPATFPADFFYGTFAGGFSYDPTLLQRVINTETQQGKERHERLKNVKNSMLVAHPAQIRGRVCIVVDDVSTTGATFAEARRALREAGASEVRCIALAQS